MSADLTKALSDPGIKTKLAATGSYTHPMTSDQVQAFVAKQQQTWLPVLQKVSTQ